MRRRATRSTLFPYTTLFRSGDEWGVRKFYAYIDGQLAGYVFFDPWFHDGRIGGYCANILRARSEEHTSELQSRPQLVCRLLLEKKKPYKDDHPPSEGRQATQ